MSQKLMNNARNNIVILSHADICITYTDDFNPDSLISKIIFCLIK